ncbi:MAG: HEPN domain-containing protein [Candidatus Aminicenantes bacterium]|jgi:uncharacterized protein (UPF0332 family)
MIEAFEECLKKRKIIPFPRAKSFVKKELKAAKDDLAEAQDRLRNDRYKYATINSYYSIFHAARALLYSKGYRERSHHCLSAAIKALYVKTGKMNNRFIRIYKNSMSLRENADYSSSFSKESAIVSVSNAQEFLEVVMTFLR